jgi:LPXTG-motif cell wall-anchored protein
LIDTGSLKSEDEITCGNGYWFFIREEELINKYVKSEIPQGFNPVSEADSVLTEDALRENEETLIPEDDDLEYPDDITQIGSKEKILEELRRHTDSENNDSIEDESNVLEIPSPVVALPTQPQRHVSKSNSKQRIEKREQKKSLFNQNILLVIVGILFVLALAGFYFRKRLIKEFIEAGTNIHLISPSYAQVIPDSVKKKLII